MKQKTDNDHPVIVILNDGGHYRSGTLRPDHLKKILEKAGINAGIHVISTLDEACQLARQVAHSRRLVVAAGGDGTVNAVASVLHETDCCLGIIPSGSGNDIARGLNIPRNLKKAVQLIKDGAEQWQNPPEKHDAKTIPAENQAVKTSGRNTKTSATSAHDIKAVIRKMDIGHVKSRRLSDDSPRSGSDPLAGKSAPTDSSHHSGNTARYPGVFVNTLGVGFDGKVSMIASRTRIFRGKTKYLYGVLTSLFSYRACAMEIILDNEPRRADADVQGHDRTGPEHIRGNFLMTTVANGPFEGGGIPIAPESDPFDGLFDVVMIRDTGFWARIPLLIRVLLKGAEDGPEILIRKTRHVHIRTGQPLYSHVDGELYRADLTWATASIKPGTLRIITPAAYFPVTGPIIGGLSIRRETARS